MRFLGINSLLKQKVQSPLQKTSAERWSL